MFKVGKKTPSRNFFVLSRFFFVGFKPNLFFYYLSWETGATGHKISICKKVWQVNLTLKVSLTPV